MSLPNVLFITYDGLTDPLGQSQILPYIEGLHGQQGNFAILSFEKPERFRTQGAEMRLRLQARGIGWYPLIFTRRPRWLAKAWDLGRMYALGSWLVAGRRIGIVHCRSYQAAQVGLWLKSLWGIRMIFDMRGLWADERVDGGLWDLSRGVPRALYRLYRWLEVEMLRRADQVVTLTEASVPVLRQRCPGRSLALTVIPCCADFELFHPLSAEQRSQMRSRLGLGDELLLGYLGSLGTWYRHREMFEFFRLLLETHPESHFLMVTGDWSPQHEQDWQEVGLGDVRQRLHLRSATRKEVPLWLGAMDLALSFIQPSFSKVASSPTKVGEVLAMGIPLICNSGVGDVQQQIEQLEGGYCLQGFAREEMIRAIQAIPALRALDREDLRDRARPLLDLSLARERYARVYRQLT